MLNNNIDYELNQGIRHIIISKVEYWITVKIDALDSFIFNIYPKIEKR